jgi:hypothetical protein
MSLNNEKLMQLITEEREILRPDNLPAYSTDIDPEGIIHIMTILRDNLYQDKLASPIREYAANARDAHASAGIPEIPIHIQLPSEKNPEVRIRDFGPGLSAEDIDHTFRKFGKSTKKNDDSQIGYYGIGCKSGWAYTDSFMVISHHKGVKTIYSCFLDSNGRGCIAQIDSSETNSSGVEVVLPIKSADISAAYAKAIRQSVFLEPRPKYFQDGNEITVDDPIVTTTFGQMANKTYSNTALAVMGGIAYPIDYSKLRCETLPPYLQKGIQLMCANPILLRFAIGEITTDAAREGLGYTEQTIQLIRSRLIEKFNECKTIWHHTLQACPTYLEALRKKAKLKEELNTSANNCFSQYEYTFGSATVTLESSYIFSHLIRVGVVSPTAKNNVYPNEHILREKNVYVDDTLFLLQPKRNLRIKTLVERAEKGEQNGIVLDMQHPGLAIERVLESIRFKAGKPDLYLFKHEISRKEVKAVNVDQITEPTSRYVLDLLQALGFSLLSKVTPATPKRRASNSPKDPTEQFKRLANNLDAQLITADGKIASIQEDIPNNLHYWVGAYRSRIINPENGFITKSQYSNACSALQWFVKIHFKQPVLVIRKLSGWQKLVAAKNLQPIQPLLLSTLQSAYSYPVLGAAASYCDSWLKVLADYRGYLHPVLNEIRALKPAYNEYLQALIEIVLNTSPDGVFTTENPTVAMWQSHFHSLTRNATTLYPWCTLLRFSDSETRAALKLLCPNPETNIEYHI